MAKHWIRRPGIYVLFAALLAMRSITITWPIEGQLVDADTQRPVAGAAVVGIWRLDMFTLDSAGPGGTVKTFATSTDIDGSFRVPRAWIVHMPLMPFSLRLRAPYEMPQLYVTPQEGSYFPILKGGPWPSRPRLELSSSVSQPGLDLYSVRSSSWASLKMTLEMDDLECEAALLCQRGDLEPALATTRRYAR